MWQPLCIDDVELLIFGENYNIHKYNLPIMRTIINTHLWLILIIITTTIHTCHNSNSTHTQTHTHVFSTFSKLSKISHSNKEVKRILFIMLNTTYSHNIWSYKYNLAQCVCTLIHDTWIYITCILYILYNVCDVCIWCCYFFGKIKILIKT